MNRSKYKTMVEATNSLYKQGFQESFDFKDGQLQCLGNQKCYNSDDITIEEQHRFEGMTNPSDNSILFAVCCNDGTKGTVVSAYGPYANAELMQFMEKLETDIA